ncbi:MAG: flavodoxin [Chloroflexi bacterium]|nr:flavodoxin [Chloroflexota bacterium]
MKALVVYESLWGNTAAIARAIAEGIGPGARALSTAEASGAVVADADLLVAGSPVLAFSLPTDKMRESVRTGPGKAPSPPDLSHPSMRSWLGALPKGHAVAAAFETRIWWSPGGATGAILAGLANAGYRTIAKAQRFIVSGTYGPLREGEVERARRWGAELAKTVG